MLCTQAGGPTGSCNCLARFKISAFSLLSHVAEIHWCSLVHAGMLKLLWGPHHSVTETVGMSASKCWHTCSFAFRMRVMGSLHRPTSLHLLCHITVLAFAGCDYGIPWRRPEVGAWHLLWDNLRIQR